METVRCRLRELRETRELSLREFAHLVGGTGHAVSHESVRQYEAGGGAVPAAYLKAVCRATGVDARWLLGLGPGRERLVASALEEIDRIDRFGDGDWRRLSGRLRAAWEASGGGFPESAPVRPAILDSWNRARRSGLRPTHEPLEIRRVASAELDARRTAARVLLRIAEPHLGWLSRNLAAIPHVVYLADAQGIVLWSTANDPDLPERWSLVPGCNWSETALGTNGAGTALATGRVTAVIGAEHLLAPFRECVCLAAPVRALDGTILGAVDVSTSLGDGDPDRLLTVAYVAGAIERELEEHERSTR